MLVDIVPQEIESHWKVQLHLLGVTPSADDALRMTTIALCVQDYQTPPKTTDGLQHSQFAYLAPAGTREQLWRLAGRVPDCTGGELPEVIRSSESETAKTICEHWSGYRLLSIAQKTRLLSLLLECSLYPQAAKLLEDEVDVDPSDEYDAWWIYQVARLVQRLGPSYGEPDQLFEAVALNAPHWWQRCAATGQLIARYARIAPSKELMSRWKENGYSIASRCEPYTNEVIDLNRLWGSRLMRAVALAETVGKQPQQVGSALQMATDFHELANASVNTNHAIAKNLLAVNMRFIVETNLKKSTPAEVQKFSSELLGVDPGCADVHYFVAMALSRQGESKAAEHHFIRCYRMGTMRAALSALALSKLYHSRGDEFEASSWQEKAKALEVEPL
ncbi:MAG: hypothetical protein WCH44_15915 [Betaproteobacteria bacterium]